jgi:hypothetical protein
MRIRGNADRAPFQFLAIEQVELARLIFANADKGVDGEERPEAADRTRECPENAKLSAIVAVIRIEGVADETAVTRFGPKESNLPLKLDRGG